MGFLGKILEHPLTRGLSVDDPRTTLLRRQIIQEKPFLKSLYAEWYERIVEALPHKEGVLELGSGAGFLQQYIPDVLTSEVFETPDVKLVIDSFDMALPDQSLNAIVMTDVLHHIPDVSRFFHEAARCIRPGGKIVMIEPWRTPWSDWVYTNLHPEPFLPDSGWEISDTGPLSGANGALPWIVFQRDRDLFEARHPQWKINNIEPMMPISYLLSGGVSMRSLMPGFMYEPVRSTEGILRQKHWAMFALIELKLST